MEEKQLAEGEPEESYFCNECGAEVAIDDKFCPKCGGDVSEVEEETAAEKVEVAAVEPVLETQSSRYPALSTISFVYKVLAVLIGIVALVLIIYGMTLLDGGRRAHAEGISIMISALILGTLGILTFLAFSEGIKLLVDLEDHSREQINLMKKLLEK